MLSEISQSEKAKNYLCHKQDVKQAHRQQYAHQRGGGRE